MPEPALPGIIPVPNLEQDLKRRCFLSAMAATAAVLPMTSLGCAQSRRPGDHTISTLAGAAGRTGRAFGAAVQTSALSFQTAEVETLVRECSSVTPEWALKWDRVAPAPGEYDFREADALVNFAARNGFAVRGHTLLWDQSVPHWARVEMESRRNFNLVHSHIEQVIKRYGTIDDWDVVNEPIETGKRPDGLRDSIYLRAFGPDYIDWAFWSAREFAPNGRRFINEYGLEYDTIEDGQRRMALLNLVDGLRRRGVPINGVGLQAHLDLRKGRIYEDGVYGLVRDLTSMGLEIAITELDVKEADTSLPTEARDLLVAEEVRRFLDVVLDFYPVRSVSTWGLSDGSSWLNEKDEPENRGLPYDAKWRPKPMRDAIMDSLEKAH